MTHPLRLLAISLLLAALTLVAFWPVHASGFLTYDDERYVTGNTHVQHGLDASTLRWAFSTFYAANWHPLTWISHALDWRIYGDLAPGHHRTNLLLHVASTILLFLFLEGATREAVPSALVAALFGVHPLHVESVAWVAERKDVLSTLFWMLALCSYLAYTKKPGAARYALLLATFALGLLAKPMLVTLPFTLLLLDVWPLGRRVSVAEKLPLFLLSLVSCVVTVQAQHRAGAIASLERFSLANRAGTALVSYVSYLWKTIWPLDLAVFYPHSHDDPSALAVGAGLLLAAVTLLALRARQKRPFLLVGWLWYLGTLVPVIGLVQVGSQAMADRYTYVPLIGIFLIVAWGIPERWRLAVAGALVLALVPLTYLQAGYWRDSLTLFRHALEVTDDNYVAHHDLAVVMVRMGRTDEALEHYAAALRIRPGYAKAHANLANVLVGRNALDEAERHAREALRLDPEESIAHYCLAQIYGRQGRSSQAIAEYEAALRIDPDRAQVHNNLGTVLAGLDRMDEATSHFEAAVRLQPSYGLAHANLAAALLARGRYVEAWREVGMARRAGDEPPAEVIEALEKKMRAPDAER